MSMLNLIPGYAPTKTFIDTGKLVKSGVDDVKTGIQYADTINK